MPRETDFSFNLHATVRCGVDDRLALAQLCRYITRPALASERVQTHASGQAVLKLKTPWRDGTAHLVMSPLEFMLLPVEGQVCGSQIHWVYVCRGSVPPLPRTRKQSPAAASVVRRPTTAVPGHLTFTGLVAIGASDCLVPDSVSSSARVER